MDGREIKKSDYPELSEMFDTGWVDSKEWGNTTVKATLDFPVGTVFPTLEKDLFSVRTNTGWRRFHKRAILLWIKFNKISETNIRKERV